MTELSGVSAVCGMTNILMTSSGIYNGNYTPAKKMISFYNSEAVLTLDDTKKGFFPETETEEDEDYNDYE